MSYKFISNFKQFSDEQKVQLESLIRERFKNKSIDKIIEIGSCAGFITLALSGLSKKVIAMDRDYFISPSLPDHLSLNHIINVDYCKTNNYFGSIEGHMETKVDAIVFYDKSFFNIEELENFVKMKQTNDVVIFYLDDEEDKFSYKTIKLPKEDKTKDKTKNETKKVVKKTTINDDKIENEVSEV